MKHTREDFKGLELGTEISNGSESFKFNHIVNDIVFVINSIGVVQAFSINLLNARGYSIQKTKKDYQGWEIGDYTGKNVWVKVKDDEEYESTYAVLLKTVTNDYFIDNLDIHWKYAVQLTEVNTEKQCNTI